MKVKDNLLLGILMLIFLQIGMVTYAQETDNTKEEQLKHLTTEQKKLLKEQLRLLDKTRAIFKENLTDKQRALLNNKSISKERKAKLLRNSLSNDQHEMIKINLSEIRSKRNLFRRSLTKNQKMRLRRFLNNRKLHDRKRLARRLRRLIQDNMDR